MNDNMQNQIDALNRKMDTVLEYIRDKQMRTMAMDDLVNDLSVIGKDVYDSSVHALDQQQIEIDPDQVRELALKFLRNINTFNSLMDSLESINDLAKDASPLITEAIIDFSKQLNQLNEKGVFDTLKAIFVTAEKLLSAGDTERIDEIGKNAELIASVIGKITDKQVLIQLNSLLSALSETQKQEIKPKSPVKLVMSKEMKQTSGFLLEFMKQLNTNKTSNIH